MQCEGWADCMHNNYRHIYQADSFLQCQAAWTQWGESEVQLDRLTAVWTQWGGGGGGGEVRVQLNRLTAAWTQWGGPAR